MAVVVVVLSFCPIRYTLSVESVDYEVALVCIVGPFEGVVASINVTLCS